MRRPHRFALAAAVAGVACGGGTNLTAAPDQWPAEAALQEATELCGAGVSLGPRERDDVANRVARQSAILAAGGLSLDETTGRIARIQVDARNACYDQVLPALSGEGGADALRILREARVSCERDTAAQSASALVQCIHQRKLEVFAAQRLPDSPHARDTLDRLLRVGGGAPLTPDARAAYCRTRELAGTGSPVCD